MNLNHCFFVSIKEIISKSKRVVNKIDFIFYEDRKSIFWKLIILFYWNIIFMILLNIFKITDIWIVVYIEINHFFDKRFKKKKKKERTLDDAFEK